MTVGSEGEIWRPAPEDVEAKFEAAWSVFVQSCSAQWANEATFQAWFAHYLIGQFGVDRVGREAIFNEDQFQLHYRPRAEVRTDVVVMRQPGIMLPHYANRLAKSDDRSGIGLMRHLAVISELKVGASTSSGLDGSAIVRDFEKLSRLMDECEATHGDVSPVAYVCVLDNHPTQRFDRDRLQMRLKQPQIRDDIKLLLPEKNERPATVPGRTLRWG